MNSPCGEDVDVVEPGQPFVIDRFRPADAAGIARLFAAVYGTGYPVRAYYDPAAIVELHARGRLHSVVARTPRGDIVGHGALYVSSSPYPRLLEIGQYVVLPSYRVTYAAFKINAFIGERLAPELDLAGFFGEAVTNHTATQKSSRCIGALETAVELALMPAEAYARERSAAGRVTCLCHFARCADRPMELFVPPALEEDTRFIYSDLGLARTFREPSGSWAAGSACRLETSVFEQAGVVRCNLFETGADLASRVEEVERALPAGRLAVVQFFLDAGEPWIDRSLDLLIRTGYFFCGWLPRWFDRDAILMQKLVVDPDFDSVKLHSPRAVDLVARVRAHWQSRR